MFPPWENFTPFQLKVTRRLSLAEAPPGSLEHEIRYLASQVVGVNRHYTHNPAPVGILSEIALVATVNGDTRFGLEEEIRQYCTPIADCRRCPDFEMRDAIKNLLPVASIEFPTPS